MYRKLFYLIILPVNIIVLFSCDGENAITNPNHEFFTSLKGKIENWTEGPNKLLILGKPGSPSFHDFGKSIIDLNGNFDMDIIPPSETIMFPIIDRLGIDSSMNFQIVNPQTKGIDGYLNIFAENTDDPIGEVKFTNDSQNNGKGFFTVSYFYSEGIIDILGSKTTQHNSDNFKGMQITNYNIHFVKGWNKLVYQVLEFTQFENDSVFYKDEWSNQDLTDGQWQYRIY